MKNPEAAPKTPCWLVGTDPDSDDHSVLVEASLVGTPIDGFQTVRIGGGDRCGGVLHSVPVRHVYSTRLAALKRLIEVHGSHPEMCPIWIEDGVLCALKLDHDGPCSVA